MLSFLQYREANLLLAEAEANTHSTHIEDLCIIDRKRGIAKALGGILHIKKQFGVSSSKQTPSVTIKIDGAPAIIAGWLSGKFFVGSKSLFNKEPKTKDELYNYYLKIIDEFPFVILEDPFNENDYETTAALTRDSGIQIVGDDLFTTDPQRVACGIAKGAANTVLLKVNQVGTITEALEMVQYAYKFGYGIMPSDSRGEGASIADYAVGINAGSVRECGIGDRGNRFLEIESELGKNAKFIGARGLKGARNQQRAEKLEKGEV